MATIGNLVVNLGAETGDFHKSMNQATRKMQSTQAQTNKSLARMERGFTKFKKIATGAVGALVGGAGFALLSRQISQSAQEVDKLNRASDRMDTTVNSLVAVRQAFGKVGLEGQEANDVLQEMQIRLGDAEQGAGPAADMVDKLGLNLDRLTNMPADKQLEAIVAEIRGMETASEQAAAASAFFSDEGVQPIVDLANKGAGAVKEARKEVQLYGKAVRGAEADSVSRMVDAWRNVQSATTGLFRQLTVEVSPALTRIGRIISDSILPAARSWGDTIRDFISVGIMRLIQLWEQTKFAALSSFASIKNAWTQALAGMKNLWADFMSSVAQGVGNIPGVGNAAKQNMRSMASSIRLEATKEAQASSQKLEKTLANLREERNRNIQAITETTNRIITEGAVLDRTSQKAGEAAQATRDQAKATRDMASAANTANAEQSAMIPAMDPIQFIPAGA